jgi:hypothetical protein
MPEVNVDDLAEDPHLGWTLSVMAHAKIQLEDHREVDPKFYVLLPNGEIEDLSVKQFGKLEGLEAKKRMRFFARRFARERQAAACTFISDVFLTELRNANQMMAALVTYSDIDPAHIVDHLDTEFAALKLIDPENKPNLVKREALLATIEGPTTEGLIAQFYKREHNKIVYEDLVVRTWTPGNVHEAIVSPGFIGFLSRATPPAGQ